MPNRARPLFARQRALSSQAGKRGVPGASWAVGPRLEVAGVAPGCGARSVEPSYQMLTSGLAVLVSTGWISAQVTPISQMEVKPRKDSPTCPSGQPGLGQVLQDALCICLLSSCWPSPRHPSSCPQLTFQAVLRVLGSLKSPCSFPPVTGPGSGSWESSFPVSRRFRWRVQIYSDGLA